MMLSGILSVLAGVLLIVVPGISPFVLTLVLGVWLVLFGAMLGVQSIRLRSGHSAAAAGSRPTPS